MDAIQARFMRLPVTSASLEYSVEVLSGPINFPPMIYRITMHELLTWPEKDALVQSVRHITNLLLKDYNRMLEERASIMDMIDRPEDWRPKKRVCWKEIELTAVMGKEGYNLPPVSVTVEGTGLEPVTPGSSDQRSTY